MHSTTSMTEGSLFP
ncbi:BgTH12-05469 [Blumeria graminis f. sp. triticale]|uniref:BgTH12-05457 n=1 Tax=Blumeria graminis f. sp. triticale TaxID=1689686 RepID=A0A9W4GFJ6_BLUGR|nr:BgTH12-05457 [Blumeria graminis f. sp. triticale]CAD6502873.1 BgTH12-05462 [Blumeria graminis f. sp. triticale]CAD6502880.1 BgTH12-05469 [Blumeria graminis f. sp. triticale]